MLLNYLFPFEDRYMIVPQWKCPEQSKLVDFTTIFIVSHNKHSVFFIEIKPSDHIRNYSPRALADKQMRERFEDLGDCVHIASTEWVRWGQKSAFTNTIKTLGTSGQESYEVMEIGWLIKHLQVVGTWISWLQKEKTNFGKLWLKSVQCLPEFKLLVEFQLFNWKGF